MLRTNTEFLSYIDSLYKDGQSGISLQNFEKDSLLLRQGEKSHRVFIIKEGIAKCFFLEENGKDYILEFMSKGQVLGEIEMIRRIDCLCNVAALTALQVYVIPAATFKELLAKDLMLNKILLEELADRIINTSSRASFQQLYTVEHGLAKLLELQEKQGMEISKEDMAAYLGITLRSLNRALKGL
ncbi:Global nitrogen regulator [compost metagenome]